MKNNDKRRHFLSKHGDKSASLIFVWKEDLHAGAAWAGEKAWQGWKEKKMGLEFKHANQL